MTSLLYRAGNFRRFSAFLPTASSSLTLRLLATNTSTSDDDPRPPGLNDQHIAPWLLASLRDPTLLRLAGLVGPNWLSSRDTAHATSTFDLTSPSTGHVIARLPHFSTPTTEQAVAAAHAAQPTWASLPPPKREALLTAWHDAIKSHREDIAIIMSAESGKRLAESRLEIDAGCASLLFYAQEIKRVTGDVLTAPSADRRFLVLRQPVGVVAAVTPWNFPMSMITRKVGPALAAGCTVVLKPA